MKVNRVFKRFVKEFGGQRQVASLLGASPGHICLLYNGKRRVTLDMAERVEIASKGKFKREELAFPNNRKAR